MAKDISRPVVQKPSGGLPSPQKTPIKTQEQLDQERWQQNINDDFGYNDKYQPTAEDEQHWQDVRSDQTIDPRTNWKGANAATLREIRQNEARKLTNDRRSINDSKSFGRENLANTQDEFLAANNQLNKFAADQKDNENIANSRVSNALNNYASSRDAALKGAASMVDYANNADKTYMTTAEKQFAANADANQRRALAVGATGGAGGLRTALATSSTANAQASQQAEIIRAQEFNQLQQAKQDALTRATAARTGVAQLDQGQQNIYGDQAKAAAAAQLGAQDQISQNIGGKAAAAASTVATETDAAVGRYKIDSDANVAFEVSQQNAAREAEARKQAQKNDNWWEKLGFG